ncbi:MAG: hypothetical protein ACPGWM_06495 [Flavobacteriales bacterium]
MMSLFYWVLGLFAVYLLLSRWKKKNTYDPLKGERFSEEWRKRMEEE